MGLPAFVAREMSIDYAILAYLAGSARMISVQ